MANGTAYTYRVAAVNAAGEGAKSNAVSVTPAGANVITASDPPQQLAAARAKGSFSVVLTWVAPADDGGSPIATYFVYRRAPGETGFTPIGLTNASTLTFTDDTVARRTTYTYYVTAFNSYDESAPSNQASLKTK